MCLNLGSKWPSLHVQQMRCWDVSDTVLYRVILLTLQRGRNITFHHGNITRGYFGSPIRKLAMEGQFRRVLAIGWMDWVCFLKCHICISTEFFFYGMKNPKKVKLYYFFLFYFSFWILMGGWIN